MLRSLYLDNIRFGKPEASLDEVERVARLAHIQEEVNSRNGTYTDIFDAMADSLNIEKIAKTIQ